MKLPERFSEDAIARWMKSATLLFILGLCTFFWNVRAVHISLGGWWSLAKLMVLVGVPAVFTATSHLLFSRHVGKGLLVNLITSTVVLGTVWIVGFVSLAFKSKLGLLAWLLGTYFTVNQVAGAVVATVIYVINPSERAIGFAAAFTALVIASRVLF